MRDSWRHFIAEFIGTFALVFIGSGAIITAHMTNGSLVGVALAHGLILSIMVTALMRISGHFNPAVTLAFMATRRIEPVMGVVYMIAQFTGAIVAAYALKAILPSDAVEATRVGGQVIAGSISFGGAVVLEMIATFFLVWVIFGTAVDPDAPRVGGFAIGLTLAAAILAIGPLTGSSLNPARSFGPAVASGILEAQAIFWIGPIVGALIAGILYDRLFLRRAPEPVDHGAVAP
ncbi:MAG TPA: aquaporin [Gemmatimonadaceae bacterium]|nr:aquaporin [Gemmatimonadaceae bacterium]